MPETVDTLLGNETVDNLLGPEIKPTVFVPGAVPAGLKAPTTPMAPARVDYPRPPIMPYVDSHDYAGESVLGISPEDIPSGAGTTHPEITIPISAVGKTAAGVAQFITSPKGMLQVGATATPAAPVVYLKWAYDLVKGGVESVTDAVDTMKGMIRDHINRQFGSKQPVDEEQVQRLADDAVNTVFQTIGAVGAGGGAIKSTVKGIGEIKARVESDRAADAVEQTAPATAAALRGAAGKGISALHKETGEILPDVRTQPGRGEEQMPAQGAGAETGARGAPAAQEEIDPTKPLVTGAAYTDPETTQTTVGPNHPEAAGKQGVDATGSRESRETPVFGFEVTDPTGEKTVVSRADAEKVAQQSGQLLEQKKPGTPHSNEIRSPQDPTKPLSEVPDRGIAASVRKKWASATDDKPLGSEAGFIDIEPIRDLVDKATPYVKASFNLLKDLAKEQSSIRGFDDYRWSVLGWSAKMQTSFQEAADAQKEITSKVPDKVRREGITNWIQADGDQTVLQQRMAATANPKLRRGYEAALNLTPDEISLANEIRQAFDTLGVRGQNHGVLSSFKDNYVTQIWDLGRGGPVTAGSRTLQQNFRFNRASTFPTFFDGEQAGFVPKTKDISKILPMYLHEMNSVISARQLVKDLSDGIASDGRSLVAPRGVGKQVDNPTGGGATLVNPNITRVKDTGDYKTIENQPALNKWNWVGTDENGNPIFLNGDLALHPEAYSKLKNVLGKSAISEWYRSEGSVASKIPKLIVHGLDASNSVTKQTMLGLLSPFHQVQEATHALGHRVNPVFSIPDVDLVNNASHRDAANHGLMLQPDRVSANQFMEGFKMAGLVSHIPILGRMANWYSDFLFHDYIPGLKLKTYDAILGRNQKVYARDLGTGIISLDEVKHLSAEQTNAAFGHLNYTDLARNPTVQHIMRLGLLAPDFLEARARFTGQAVKGTAGTKVGREQAIALATLALGQAATAYTAAQLTGGTWDKKHPFEFHKDNRRYSMRSVPEDIANLLSNTRVFVHSRISPIIGKGALQLTTGVDWQGRKISAQETLQELAEQPIPISVKGFVGLGSKNLSGLEQLASSAGLRISRYSAQEDVFKLVDKWMKDSPDAKVQEHYKQKQQTTYPESVYKPLRNALSLGDETAARKAYDDLLKTHTVKQITNAMKPKPFTGSHGMERDFLETLDEEDRKTYDAAMKEREDMFRKLQELEQ